MAFRARYVGCVVAIAFVCSAASAASVYEWERMDGPYGGSVSGLRRGHNGEVFVEANRETYVLSEEARAWRPAEPLPSTRYQIDDQGSWYWLDIRGIDYEAWVMRSDDEGETWQRVLRFRGTSGTAHSSLRTITSMSIPRAGVRGPAYGVAD
jgi:photosystem II stability/assembly factor-like uncharacterized protein